MESGNPIQTATGNKVEKAEDYVGTGPLALEFVRYYNSHSERAGALGASWSHSYSGKIETSSATAVDAVRADGKTLSFRLSNGVWTPDADVNARLTAVTDNSGTLTGWQYTTGEDAVEGYDGSGRLLSITNRAGVTQTLSYDGQGRLAVVTDAFGRTLRFGYDAQGRLASLTDPGGGVYAYDYDSGNNLTQVTYPDSRNVRYLYENAAFPHALTGIVDETGSRFATYSYDSNGLAISSERAGGTAKVTLSYGGSDTTTVTDALGQTHEYTYATTLGVPRPVQAVGPAGLSFSSSYDANGNVTSETNRNGTITTYTYDLNRNLEVSRTEAVGLPEARTMTTQWHADFRLPTKLVEPTRTTEYSYDPRGNLIQRTVTATDTGRSRTWRYRYNNFGQVTQIDGPRTDVADLTTLAYDSQGNLAQVADGLGHVTRFDAYDAHGRLLSMTDPNGLVTTFSYDPRGRLVSESEGGETTTYSRDAVGQVTRVTFPDGSYLSYRYDAAHRLTGVSDNLGNQVAYTLDAIGNVTREDISDPQGELAQTVSRQYDALNRLSAVTGAQNQTTRLQYDGEGNVIYLTSPLSHTATFSYDGLSRMVHSANAIAGASFSFDAADHLTSVQDGRGLVTQYGVDGLGNALSTRSPDTGLSQQTFDEAGNVRTAIDARGRQVNYSYDALNRLTQMLYANAAPIVFTYDQGANGTGHLTGMTDASGSTTWGYDVHGRLIRQTQQVGGRSFVTQYAYDAAGRRVSMTYPSGQVIGVGYAAGQVSQLTAGNATLLAQIAYEPFGPARSWTFGNGTPYSRSYDQDGRLTSYPLGSSTVSLNYDAAGRITGSTDSGSPVSQSFTYDTIDRLVSFSGPGTSESYAYDAAGNRVVLSAAAINTYYTIDNASNRLTGWSDSLGGSRTLSYDDSGNTLSDGTSQFTYDGRGRLVSVSNSEGFTQYLVNGLGQRVAKISGAALDLAGDVDGDGVLTVTDMRRIVLMARGIVTPVPAADCNRDGSVTTADVTCVQTKITELRVNPGKYAQSPTYFVYDPDGHLIGEYSSSGNPLEETVYLENQPVAILAGGSSFYVYADHLDTPRLIVSEAGTPVWRWDSDPFGKALPNESPSGAGTFTYNLRFPGQYYDKETGLHYNYFRDYNPSTGRYIQSDPIGLAGGYNTYIYAESRPIGIADPTGENPWKFFGTACTIIGFTTCAYNAYEQTFGTGPGSDYAYLSRNCGNDNRCHREALDHSNSFERFGYRLMTCGLTNIDPPTPNAIPRTPKSPSQHK
ncbi:MAG: Protein RhsD [Gammaproteobacteria bacterium]|nr:Protein RhsD [Gammaproteobacteria bacterium]